MADSTGKYEMSIRLISFSGKKKGWIAWEEKFLAQSKCRGSKDILLGKVLIPLSTATLDSTDPDEAKLIVKSKNEMNKATPN